jgi:hypothetical protein
LKKKKKKLGDGSEFTLYNALSSTGGDAKEIYRKIYSAIRFSESFATTKEFTAHGVYKKDAKSVHKIDEK